MKSIVTSFTIGALFSSVVGLAVVYKLTKGPHMPVSECLVALIR